MTIGLFYDRLHPDDRQRTRQAIEASIVARTAYDVDYRTVSSDGSETKWIRAMGRGFYDDAGDPVRFDGITIDGMAYTVANIAHDGTGVTTLTLREA